MKRLLLVLVATAGLVALCCYVKKHGCCQMCCGGDGSSPGSKPAGGKCCR